MTNSFSAADHTFVVSAYGKSEYLEDCVNSLLSQSVKSNILISTSTPNSQIEVIAQKYQLPLYISTENPGIAEDWNRAISHASTPLVTVAHQDDIYLPQYTETMLKLVNFADNPLIFFCNYGELRSGVSVDDSNILRVKRCLLAPLTKSENWTKKRVRRRALSLGCSICCPSVTLNLNKLEWPVFQTGLKSNLDWEAWESISRLDGSFVYADSILMRHRIHEGSETTALIENNTRTAEDYEMLRKFWPDMLARFINVFYSTSQKSNYR